MSATPRKIIWSLLPLAVSSQLTAALAEPLACDDGVKQAFRPDESTRVVAVRLVKKGEELLAPDAPTPITAAADLCLVKLLVGPGVTAEKDKSARSYSEGIGIEVWLPTPANWNERIRNYGGGGWVGGGHRYADKIGSKVPAIVNANVGYASGTTDAGQPWYQDGSFTFLSDGKVNTEALRSFSVGAMVEQAVKTRALVNLYYGKSPKFAYYDGHSQGGRQGMKIAQDFPELYDGYLIAQPALNIARFGTASIYPQIVMKTELGITALNKDQAAAFASKVDAVNKRAVATCDKAGLGFLLDPFACDYDPARDAAALCTGEVGTGVAGSSNDAATCMSASEARALGKIWYGATRDGSVDTAQTRAARSGKSLGNAQLWWTFTRGTAITSLIKSASTDSLALALQDVRYAADAGATSSIPIANGSTSVRNKWLELDYAGVADAVDKNVALQPTLFAGLSTDKVDLAKLRDLGRKVIVWSGLADDAIPPAGNVNYHERVVAAMGGDAEVQKFMRMYLLPGVAHSSQGRAYAAGGRNDAVPLPKLPGNANQKPAREQDQFFSALTDWVERGVVPEEIVLVSRDNSVSYPACVYPLMTTWNGSGPATQPSSFGCR
ncbi:tannase/feruloyl esterase family alpha/beta hydrolase [Bradyrhizobium sp. 14AA]